LRNSCRRYQRWLNKTFLREQEIYLESSDLLVYEHVGSVWPGFVDLFEPKYQQAWAPFVESETLVLFLSFRTFLWFSVTHVLFFPATEEKQQELFAQRYINTRAPCGKDHPEENILFVSDFFNQKKKFTRPQKVPNVVSQRPTHSSEILPHGLSE
jgi:hypothetical protein